MQRTRVSSSNIASVGYDPESQVLEVEFHGGGVYRYSSVPARVYDAFLRAPSKGSYFHSHVKDIYPCRQVS